MGWIFCSTSFSASRSSSPASTTTEVVPSPTSASCTLLMSARRRRAPRHVLAAGPLTWYPSCPSAMSVQHHAVTPMHLSMTLSCCLASIRPLQACGQALSHRPVLWHCLPPSATARASATAGSTALSTNSPSSCVYLHGLLGKACGQGPVLLQSAGVRLVFPSALYFPPALGAEQGVAGWCVGGPHLQAPLQPGCPHRAT